MEKIKEIIYNDLELYFYLYRDRKEWDLAVHDTYLERARTTQVFFLKALEKYCMDNHYEISDREYEKDGVMNFVIRNEDRSI